MAVQAYVGSFTLETTTGNQEVNPAGLGFAPTAVIFFSGNMQTADGVVDEMGFFMSAGDDDPALSRVAAGSWSDDGAATSSCSGYVLTNRVILFSHFSAPQADLVSLDADGFTINITSADVTGRVVNYLLLGGDVTGVEAFIHNLGSGNGTKSKTGLAGTPAAVLFFAGVGATSDTVADGAASGSCMAGWMCADGTQGYTQTRHTNAVGAADTITRQRTDKCCGLFTTTGEIYEGEFVSMDANGYTINLDNGPTANVRVHGVAIYGGVWTAAAMASPTGTGNFDLTTTGVDPSVILLQTRGLTAGTTSTAGGQRGFGAASSSSRRGTIYYGDTDGADPTESATGMDRTKALAIGGFVGGSLVVSDAYDLVSFGTEKVTLNHTTASGTAIQLIGLVAGVTTGGGPADDLELLPARMLWSQP